MLQKALGFNIATPVFDGAKEIDIQDTLELANDYVNFEWEDFEANTKMYWRRSYEVLMGQAETTEHCGKVFQFPVMEKFSCVMDVPENHLIHL